MYSNDEQILPEALPEYQLKAQGYRMSSAFSSSAEARSSPNTRHTHCRCVHCLFRLVVLLRHAWVQTMAIIQEVHLKELHVT